MIGRFALTLAFAFTATACQAQPTPPNGKETASATAIQPVTISAEDGVTVHGVYYPAPKPKATILLFHQAGSSKGEYATIAPRLVGAGYSALAIDQRSGGGLFGANETATALGREAGYLEAKRDLAAALGWAGGKGAPVIVWGSSYSASLVLLLAAENPGKIAAVLAFSPGEYFGGGTPVRSAAAKVAAPVFVTSAAEAGEIAEAKAIFDAAPSSGKARFVPKSGGVHGSSTLIARRNARGAEENWAAVLAFLDGVKS